MKPNFALSLSSDGIRLLHRAAGGWRRVGTVGLDVEDIAIELAVLRKTAAALDPEGVRTKLVLPDDQIRFLSVETGMLEGDARRQAALRALDGATPYPVSALVVDIAADGTTTHVAAVARETLAEAEAFATQHRFHPVCFVAAPELSPFPGEPNFGPTKHSAVLLGPDETVEPDGVAVVEIGEIEVPDGPVATDPPLAQAGITADSIPDVIDATAAPPIDEPDPVSDPPHPPEQQTAPQATLPPTPPISFASRRANGDREESPAQGDAPREAVSDEASPEAQALSTAAVESFDRPGFVHAEPDTKETGGFLSRRRVPRDTSPETALAEALTPPKPVPPPRPPRTPVPASEAQRMTVFGARQHEDTEPRDRPRRTGLVLTGLMLVVLAGVGTWAALGFSDGMTRLLGPRPTEPEIATAPAITPETTVEMAADPETPEASEPQVETSTSPVVSAPPALPSPQADAPPSDDGVTLAALDEGLTDEDAAVLDALRDPQPEPADDPPLTDTELEARYAATGIWPRAPQATEPASLVQIEDLYLTSIDRISPAQDAVALPQVDSFGTDEVPGPFSSPAPPDTAFQLDDRGLVIPTPEGAVSPEGAFVRLGRPPLVPPLRPSRTAEPQPEDPARADLAGFRPRPRPVNLIEDTERAKLGGVTRSELAETRPRARPDTVQSVTPAETPSSIPAITTTLRPNLRPRALERAVAARPAPSAAPAAAPSTASVAPATVNPRIPSSASVAREATVRNALNLNRVNLIGVYGKPSERRALIRLANGRYQKVKVGDRIDGGRVSAIGDAELRYQKGSRSVVLKMPKS